MGSVTTFGDITAHPTCDWSIKSKVIVIGQTNKMLYQKIYHLSCISKLVSHKSRLFPTCFCKCDKAISIVKDQTLRISMLKFQKID